MSVRSNSIAPRSVLITGCSSGIGLHAATSLAERGYQVIATVRQKTDIAKLHNLGLKQVLWLDLEDSVSIRNAAEQALELSGGTLSGLVNNGAYGLPGAVEELTRDALRRQFETNLFGWIELTNSLIPHFLTLPSARIVQISSVLGLVAMPYRGAYNASKFALEGITDTLRLELIETKVDVSLIEPGPIVSEFRANCLKALERDLSIDIERSRHRQGYERALARLQSEQSSSRFTLGPEAVTKKIIHAMESAKPRHRYAVTRATKIMAILRRVLPSSALDSLVVKY